MTRIPEPREVDLVLYHASCTDGFTAAWAAWHRLKEEPHEVEYIAVQYGQDPPDVAGRKVALVDFCYDRDVLQEMAEKADALVVLDHHKTAQDQLKGLSYAKFDMEKSGAVMSWEFFHPQRNVPRHVLYVQDYDLWQWKLGMSKEFSAGLALTEFDFEKWEEAMLHKPTPDFIQDGTAIRRYVDNQTKRLAKHAVLVEINGQQMWMTNSSNYQSEIGDILSNREDEVGVALIWFYHNQDRVLVCSLRSRKGGVDVGKFAADLKDTNPRVLSGGGHAGAGGFVWNGTIEELVTFV